MREITQHALLRYLNLGSRSSFFPKMYILRPVFDDDSILASIFPLRNLTQSFSDIRIEIELNNFDVSIKWTFDDAILNMDVRFEFSN